MATIKPDPQDLALTAKEAEERYRAARKRLMSGTFPSHEEFPKPPLPPLASLPTKSEPAENDGPLPASRPALRRVTVGRKTAYEEPPQDGDVPLPTIAEVVAKVFDCTVRELIGRQTGRTPRLKEICLARGAFCHIARLHGWRDNFIGLYLDQRGLSGIQQIRRDFVLRLHIRSLLSAQLREAAAKLPKPATSS